MSKLLQFIKPSADVTKWLVLLSLGMLALLTYYGYFDQIKAVLNQPAYTFKLSGVKLSPYILLKGALTIILTFWMAGLLSDFATEQFLSAKNLKPATRSLFAKFSQISIYILCGLIVLKVLGIDLTALAVFSGAIGIGLGFGLQKITSNFISGLILLFERTIQVDDLVELTDGTQGFVRYLGARYTLVETFDSKEIMIPNEDFIVNRLTNLTYNDKKAQIQIQVCITYESDLELALRLMKEAASRHPRVIHDPEPNSFIETFADSGITLLLQFWVADVTDGRLAPKSDVMLEIWKSFKQHGVEMAYPHLEIVRSRK